MRMQGIEPTIRMDQRKEIKMSVNADERENCAECNCDSENACNCAANNVNHVLNANANDTNFRENETQAENVEVEPRNDRELKHRGKGNDTKEKGITRTCSANVHGFGGNNDVKTEQIMQTTEKMNADMTLLNETNCKWNTRTVDITQ